MYLVNSPEAADFLVGMGTETRRKVALGDKAKFNGTRAYNYISSAHNAVAEGIPKIIALAQDPVRTLVDQHHAAQQVTGRISGVVAQSQAGIEADARALVKEGGEIVDRALVLDQSRQFIHGRIADWIKEQSARPEGIMQIREATATHSEVAALLYHMPHFLTGLSEDTRGNIVLDGFRV